MKPGSSVLLELLELCLGLTGFPPPLCREGEDVAEGVGEDGTAIDDKEAVCRSSGEVEGGRGEGTPRLPLAGVKKNELALGEDGCEM